MFWLYGKIICSTLLLSLLPLLLYGWVGLALNSRVTGERFLISLPLKLSSWHCPIPVVLSSFRMRRVSD